MRLPVETCGRHARRYGLALILAPALAACGGSGDYADLALAPAPAGQLPANGPAADYPVVVGDAYRIGATLYTPADTLNYDEVGYLAADAGSGISGSHHTLPLPSYVEVTSLETGRTILVRLERRGPMNGNSLVALSPAALAQLGAGAGAAIRVRRVNPPEEERAFLRAGQTVPPRMDTPEALVAVLRRKLPEGGVPAPAPALAATNRASAVAAVELPPSAVSRAPMPATAAAAPASARPVPLTLPPLPSRAGQAAQDAPAIAVRPQQPQPARPAPVSEDGAYVVQAAALSSYDRARRIAGAIGGTVSQVGSLYRVRVGPFATRSQAEASLAKVRAAGYSDARIFTRG